MAFFFQLAQLMHALLSCPCLLNCLTTWCQQVKAPASQAVPGSQLLLSKQPQRDRVSTGAGTSLSFPSLCPSLSPQPRWAIGQVRPCVPFLA